MHDRFGYPGLFAAYNAGPARYAKHLATGRRLSRETLVYVGKVARPLAVPAAAAGAPTVPDSLFVRLTNEKSALRHDSPSLRSAPNPIFAVLGPGSAGEP